MYPPPLDNMKEAGYYVVTLEGTGKREVVLSGPYLTKYPADAMRELIEATTRVDNAYIDYVPESDIGKAQ